jgi:hypothetical protein
MKISNLCQPSLFFSVAVLVFALSVKAYGQETNIYWGPATNDFLMSIELKNGAQELTNGQPCVLTIRFKNVSKSRTVNVWRLWWTEGDHTYSFTVSDPSGKDISPVWNEAFGGSGGAILVRPGEIKGIEFNLTTVCKINAVGNYRVTAKKEARSDDGNQFQVVSNPLLFSVVSFR